MGRPSVAEERRQQIVDATIRTIGAHGITGATMDRIADEAGMSRGHVRHFVGNRDELLVRTTRYFYFGEAGSGTLVPDDTSSIDEAIEFLFSDEFVSPGMENAVVLGLVEASRSNPAIATIMGDAYSDTQRVLADLIGVAAPTASDLTRQRAAYSVLTAALGNVFLADLGAGTAQSDVGRSAAFDLIAALRASEA